MKAKDMLHIYSTIADLKLIDYRNTLAVATLIRLLESKGIFTEEEFRALASQIDSISTEDYGQVEDGGMKSPNQELTHL